MNRRTLFLGLMLGLALVVHLPDALAAADLVACASSLARVSERL